MMPGWLFLPGELYPIYRKPSHILSQTLGGQVDPGAATGHSGLIRCEVFCVI